MYAATRPGDVPNVAAPDWWRGLLTLLYMTGWRIDFRRAFATENAERVSAPVLQTLMRHKAFKTTLGYIDKARQTKPAVANLFVPTITRKEKAV